MHGNILDANSTNKIINQSLEEYVKKTDIPQVDASDFVSKTATDTQSLKSQLQVSGGLSVIGIDNQNYIDLQSNDGNPELSMFDLTASRLYLNATGISILKGSIDGISITSDGISKIDGDSYSVFATDGSIASLSQFVDTTELSNYVLTTALNQQINTLNTAISAKQDAGNYVEYSSKDGDGYHLNDSVVSEHSFISKDSRHGTKTLMHPLGFNIEDDNASVNIGTFSLDFVYGPAATSYTANGISVDDLPDSVPLTNSTFKPISDFVLTTDLSAYDKKIAALEARIAALEAKHPETAA